jgi:hypothetical protein
LGIISSLGTLWFSRAKAISSPTLKATNWASESCRTVPTVLLNAKMLAVLVSLPAILHEPVILPSYEKGFNPLMQLAKVDFPLPLGPNIKTFSP